MALKACPGPRSGVEAVEAFDGGEPGLPDPPFDHPAFALDQFQFARANKVAHMVDALGGALAGQLVILTQESRQLQGFQMMGQQELWRIAHAEAPVGNPMCELAEVVATSARGK